MRDHHTAFLEHNAGTEHNMGHRGHDDIRIGSSIDFEPCTLTYCVTSVDVCEHVKVSTGVSEDVGVFTLRIRQMALHRFEWPVQAIVGNGHANTVADQPTRFH